MNDNLAAIVIPDEASSSNGLAKIRDPGESQACWPRRDYGSGSLKSHTCDFSGPLRQRLRGEPG